MQPILGQIRYHAGDDGTVSLEPGETLLGLWCVASGTGATLSIDGGDDIPLVAGIPFAFALESFTAEWVGIDIVFTSTTSYFVKTKSRLSLP